MTLQQMLLRVAAIDKQLEGTKDLYAEKAQLLDQIIPRIGDRISIFAPTTVLIGRSRWLVTPSFVKGDKFANNAWKAACIPAFTITRIAKDTI